MKIALDSAKTVFLFPGVGVQRPDMFAEFKTYPEYRACLDEVSDLSQVNLHEVIHGERHDSLKQVRIAQLALTATTVAIANILRRHGGLVPEFMMGHSLGQYPALCSAGYLDLATLTKIVNIRSEVVEACARDFQQGDMFWVLHIPADVVIQEVEKARTDEGIEIYISAVDAFDQVTISGEMADIRRFAPRMETLGGLVFPLKIGGPFHSPLMAEAKEKLAVLLDFLPDSAPQHVPLSRLVCNVTGGELQVENLKSSILQHLISPVQWLPSLQYVAQKGVTRYLEISPKNVLSYLTQRTNLPMRSLCEPDELFTFAQELNSEESRLERFSRYCHFHLYSSKVPAMTEPKAIEQLHRIREQTRQRITGSRLNTEECHFLHQMAQQWLDVLEVSGNRPLLMEKAKLQSLFDAVRH
ncbi:putative polyketide synthase Pks1 [Xenorhabdus mauleonii]|uniref:[acyl-carrier-protein] S-malonyltransferase n=1 Tax=Xenorhabdus mauleonii TaxID=351675 RepID=A0A1I3JHR4_9GAMM|nr:ACP S-malonyltransferase [Xenorhabdus mauleonii]PHM46208.1 putative polyketide synthase Pks1 [Xenorhabdus mauleonii]SFI59518.1 [acyl-carrier-protein] S-malonyltransferase [Xenorhabdus mauleonii]